MQNSLEQRRDTLQSEWNLRSEIVKRMRVDLAIETGTAVKFQLEQQFLEREAKLAYLETELDSIDKALT